MLMTFPTISINADSVIRYRSDYESYDNTAKSLSSIRFPYDGIRRIILSASTNGATLTIGLHSTVVEDPIDDGGGNWSLVDGEPDTTIAGSGKLIIPELANMSLMIPGSLKLFFDDVQVANDVVTGDTSGKWYGSLLVPDAVYSSTISYTDGASAIYFTVLPDPAPSVISLAYTSITADADTKLVMTGAAPLDLSTFLRNAPYSYFEEDKDLVITPASNKNVSIAYASMKI